MSPLFAGKGGDPLGPPKSARVPVLLYHSVNDDPPGRFGPYAVSRHQFAAHLDELVALDVTTLTVGQLLAARAAGTDLPERTAVITFDDGFADFAAYAWPELAARGLATTLYVTTGTLDGTSDWLAPLGAGGQRMLSRQQIRELAAQGCEMGAHSVTHPELDCVPPAVARQEIEQSKTTLEQILGTAVTTFAYPHGYHDARVKELVVEAGYASAAAVKNALSPADDDVFALARVTVTADVDLDRFTDTLAGSGVPVGRAGEKLRTKVWRQARRRQHRRASTLTTKAAA